MAASTRKVNVLVVILAVWYGIISTWTKARVEFLVENVNNNCVTTVIRALCENTSSESTE